MKIFTKKKFKQRKKKQYQNFLIILLAFIFLPAFAVSIFNWCINPYDVFNTLEIKGFNQAKPEKLKNTRLFKAVAITRLKPITVFLGSSRTDYGLEPNHPALTKPAYNLGLGASSPYELLAYLRHTIYNQKNVQQIVIGLDEFMFNAHNEASPDFSEARLEKKNIILQDTINTTFSLDAFTASKETIETSKSKPNYITYSPQGQLQLRLIDRDKSATNYRFNTSISFYFKSFPQDYKLSSKHLNDLKKIIKLAQDNNIKIKAFISPSHATRYEAIRVAGHWQEYEEMKRQLVKILPVWDFSGYNSITTEPISENIENYIDDSHYKEKIGNLVLNRLFNYEIENVPDDFGVLITPQNIESHLAKIRSQQTIWRKNNPEEVEMVKNLQKEVTKKIKD